MKRYILAGMMLVAACARGSVSYSTGAITEDTVIPNGSPVGVAFTVDITAVESGIPAGDVMSGLTVGMDISGGYNGGLVAYLVAPNGTMVYLVDQPGTSSNPFGTPGSGMNVTMQDGSTSIQDVSETAGVQLTGTCGAAGTLANVNGSSPDGDWTLFFANLSSGGANGELLNFSLDLTAVPEPVGMGLGIFGGVVGLWFGLGLIWKLPRLKTVKLDKINRG